jgi:hypothetical protein
MNPIDVPIMIHSVYRPNTYRLSDIIIKKAKLISTGEINQFALIRLHFNPNIIYI